jgi:hypothetical protein
MGSVHGFRRQHILWKRHDAGAPQVAGEGTGMETCSGLGYARSADLLTGSWG